MAALKTCFKNKVRGVNNSKYKVQDTPFDPDIRSKKAFKGTSSENGDDVYLVLIKIIGSDLTMIDNVVYSFPENISQKNATIKRTALNEDCRMRLWVGKQFKLVAKVTEFNGDVHVVSHKMEFLDYIAGMKKDKIRVVQYDNTRSDLF